MSTISHPIVAFGVKKDNVPGVLDLGKRVQIGLSGHLIYFPSPPLTPTVFGTQVQTLDEAQIATKNRATGTFGARDRCLDTVWISLKSFKGYVQTCADNDLAHAAEIIAASGFPTARTGSYERRLLLLTAIPGVSGGVHARVNATMLHGKTTAGVTYLWQVSVDGGHTYLPPSSTPIAMADLLGLPLSTELLIRVGAIVHTTIIPYSAAESIFLR